MWLPVVLAQGNSTQPRLLLPPLRLLGKTGTLRRQLPFNAAPLESRTEPGVASLNLPKAPDPRGQVEAAEAGPSAARC